MVLSSRGERLSLCMEKRDTICELVNPLTKRGAGRNIRNIGAREDRKMQETSIFNLPRLKV